MAMFGPGAFKRLRDQLRNLFIIGGAPPPATTGQAYATVAFINGKGATIDAQGAADLAEIGLAFDSATGTIPGVSFILEP